MGSSSLVSMLAGIARAKVIAVLLGPAGVGLVGLLQSLLGVAGTFAGLGLANSGVQQVAAARGGDDQELLAGLRATLWPSTLLSSALVAGLVIVFSPTLAVLVLEDRSQAWVIAWLAPAIVATAITGAHQAWINGFRQLRNLASIAMLGSLSGALIGCISVWIWGSAGIVPAVVLPPLVTLAAASWFASKIRVASPTPPLRERLAILRRLVSLGLSLMLTGLIASGTQVAVRWLIASGSGLEMAGQYQAAWGISTLYLALILNAMTTDYYAELSEQPGEHERVIRLVNEQSSTALVMIGPLLLGMYCLAPLLVRLLYSGAFDETSTVLRWQVLGDLFKVPGWALAFVLIAQRRVLAYIVLEIVWHGLYLLFIWQGQPHWGVEAAGMAYMVAYIIYTCLLWIVLRRAIVFAWVPEAVRLFTVLLASLVGVAALQRLAPQLWPLQALIVAAVSTMTLSQVRAAWRRPAR